MFWKEIAKKYVDWELSDYGSSVALLDKDGNVLDKLSISGLIDGYITDMVKAEKMKEKLKGVV